MIIPRSITSQPIFLNRETKTSLFASYILYLTLFKQYYTEDWLSQEEILNLIPKSNASRSTLINLINFGISEGYILMRISLCENIF